MLDTPVTAAPEAIGVVLMNMGGPASLDEVRPYLVRLFSDPSILPLPTPFRQALARFIAWRRAPKSRGFYARIGGRSPILDLTREQALRLEDCLSSRSGSMTRWHCQVAMRYSRPTTEEAVRTLLERGVRTIVALPLYPHHTRATRGSSLAELARVLDRLAPAGVRRVEVGPFFDHPLYLDALAQQINADLAAFPTDQRSHVTLLFSAHGLPRSFVADPSLTTKTARRGDPYVAHLRATIEGVLARLGTIGGWRLSYQSRAGRAWLGPSTSEVLRRLADEARSARIDRPPVLAVPISFVCDHLETLFELDLLLAGQAADLGLAFRRAPSLNAAPRFIATLAALVEEAVARPAAAATPEERP